MLLLTKGIFFDIIFLGGDEMNDRLKLLRTTLNLSQEIFGEKLGVGKTAISKLEKGENNLTEQMIKLICGVYNVDYGWLTIGKGEMFITSDDNTISLLDRIMASENKTAKRLFRAFANLSEDDWIVIEKIIDNITENKNNT
jgi:transcriptional regulator with XRE-family HTH domain